MNGKVFIKSPSVPDDELNFMKYTTVKRIPLLLRKLEILIVIQPKSAPAPPAKVAKSGEEERGGVENK